MFRIRRVYDDATPGNKDAISQVQAILRSQFPGLPKADITKLPRMLRNPLKYSFRSILFIAEDSRDRIKGFALLSHEPVLNFCYLDYISTARLKMGGGIGGALYERVREESLDLNTLGIFFECLPDDPKLSRNPDIRKQNIARLRFYERYGARPIINTAYETPLEPEGDNPPYLVFDNLGQETELGMEKTQTMVRAILERKYGNVCPVEYIDMVVASFRDDPVRIRKPKYFRKTPIAAKRSIPVDKRIALIINDRHAIHHVEERGYVESPVRIDSILKEISETDYFQAYPPRRYSESHIRAVHDEEYIDYFKNVCADLAPGESVYPYVFPIRNRTRPPKELPVRAGYYCIDTFTPLNRNAFLAARRAVDCAITAAWHILDYDRLAYALVRPPGHHAESDSFGGFCYFNSVAVAANYLTIYGTGKVAILDVDYHHGNGQQDIFWSRGDVLTVSLHGHPSFAYPYFSGFADEKGDGEGKNCNLNIPLRETTSFETYKKSLTRAINRIDRFNPAYLIIALGLDTAREDPTGSWSFEADNFEEMGRMIGGLHLPTVAVQEGGYDTRVLGINALHFFKGLWSAVYSGAGRAQGS